MNTEHSIFKTAVEVYDQKHCDIAREICERYELPIWKEVDLAFEYMDDDEDQYLKYCENNPDDRRIGFYIDTLDEEDDLNIMSMEEFEALADDYNPQFKSVEDALSKIKEINNLLNNK
jgi:hypothetical protein